MKVMTLRRRNRKWTWEELKDPASCGYQVTSTGYPIPKRFGQIYIDYDEQIAYMMGQPEAAVIYILSFLGNWLESKGKSLQKIASRIAREIVKATK
jgi:hypothetical protein